MELFKLPFNVLPPDTPKEIDERLRRRYLDRLCQRVKKLRRLLIERSWEDLRAECAQLATSGENFGFPHLTVLATHAQRTIPKGKLPRAATPLHAKEVTESLINAIDGILMENAVHRA